MDIIDTVSRIVHVSTAIVLVGGSVFTLFVLIPAAKRLGDDAHQQLAADIKQRWKPFIHGGILLFLVSGFYNYFRAMSLHKGDGLYHALIGSKMLIALVIFLVASALVGRGNATQRMRDNREFWLKVVVILATVVVSFSGYLKVRGGQPPKAQPVAESTES